jgi:hypothetical protein
MEKFSAKPGGLELAETKDKTLLWLDFFYFIHQTNLMFHPQGNKL